MLLALTTAFALSQAFRTVAAILAAPLRADFGLSAQQLGLFAGAFHFSFGALQLFMGIGIDLHGVRRTVLAAFPLAVAGAVLSALAPSFGWLVLGQVLIGIGCAPAFLVCTVFIARHFPAQRFAAVSGLILGIGGSGMLVTGTPLAWLVEASSWRMGFWVLALCAALAWGVIAWLVREPLPSPGMTAQPRESLGEAIARFGALFTLRHTLGIVALAAVTYASFITLRGLWLGPLLMERYHFSLVQSGNVVLIVSAVSLVGPPLFGRLDPGDATRRTWLIGFTLLLAGLFAALALTRSAAFDIGASLVIGLMSGYMVLQYADVRAAYPAAITGRAMVLFTMALFLGVALMQWFTGVVASLAAAHGIDAYAAVLATIAALLAAGALAFAWLPGPPARA
jgi:predicted MFS family arabinose efflux permease